MDLGNRMAQLFTALFALLGPDQARTTLDAIDAQVPLDAPDRGLRRFALLEAAMEAATGGAAVANVSGEAATGGAIGGHAAPEGRAVTPERMPEDEARAAYWAGVRSYATPTLSVWRALLRQARGRRTRQAFWTRPALMRWAGVKERQVSGAIARLVADHALTRYASGQRRWRCQGRRAGSEAVVPVPPPIP